ncbi:7-cyano-7-deazaguanine synthase [Rhizobium sp. S9]|uniref:7-cyano-7-deazaguanine synthase n=1 Tax=Rhizobium sp. S9 TaxID=2035454 RepID=UPI001FE0E9D6|nr:7-cyano-7-deazaguanine synthase [Rhizobium sp. S9]
MDQMKTELHSEVHHEKHLFAVEKGRAARHPELDKAVVAEIGKHIQFVPDILDTFDVKGFAAKHYDLMVLAAAIEFADRRWRRPASWLRNLHVTIPVIHHACWSRPDVQSSLRSAMNFLTGDSWRFTFVKAANASPIGWRQVPLMFEQPKTFAIAYSNGLDSRAVSALSGPASEALCIRVASTKQRRMDGDSHFTQIPFRVKGFKGKESSFRSRGFQFAAMATIASHLSNISRIIVPESGQGALGPVLVPLYNIYTDYRNFPAFFRKMERFTRALLDCSIKFEQPHLWSTKGETMKAFLGLPDRKHQHLINTRSCWQTRRIVNAEHRRQCGLCAACLLRRMSLHAAEIVEPSDTYVVSDLSASEVDSALASITDDADRDIMVEYGSVGARHLDHLATMSELADAALRPFASQIAAATGEAYEQTLRNLRIMLMTHAQEWRTFLSAQGEKSFLNSWMDGGRYDRSK